MKKPNVKQLQFQLDAAYNFIEITNGKEALDKLKERSSMEYAILMTDKVLQTATLKEFERARKNIGQKS